MEETLDQLLGRTPVEPPVVVPPVFLADDGDTS
jgi:hypothetical protein